MREFAFELELCAALEERRDGIVARQLGASVAAPSGRIVDVVVVEPGPQFDRRTTLTPETIPDVLLTADVGPGRWTPVRDALACHPERARTAVERGVEIGFLEHERRNGRDCIRQVARYPDWAGRLVAIENKPDLGTPGDLDRQLRTDVSLALVDEIVLATESYVTGAHLNRLPDPVGVWRVHRDDASAPARSEIEVLREPAPLPVDEPGIEPRSSHPGRTDVAIVSPEEKADARRRIAERVYGKGWRTFGFPACATCEPTAVGGEAPSAPGDDAATSEGDGTARSATLPHCPWKGRVVDAAAECGPACPGYESAAPPAVDLDAERDARTPWTAEPETEPRRQAGLDRFGDE